MHGINPIGGHIDYANAALGDAPAHRAGCRSRAFEADMILRVGVAHIYRTGGGMHRHVKQSRADTADLRHDGRQRGIPINGKEIKIGQGEFDLRAPIGARFIAPRRPIEPHNQAGARCHHIVGTPIRQRLGTADGITMQRGGSIARHERCRIDTAAIGTDGQCARCVGEKREDGQWFSVERIVERRGIEHPHIRASLARGCKIRPIKARTILPACGGRDEGAIPIGAGKYDIARLIAHQQGAQHARRAIETHHAHRVR